MRKIITYSSFIATGLVEVFAFVTANTYTQLGIAIVFYPLMALFAYKLFISKNRKAFAKSVKSTSSKLAKKIEIETDDAKKERVAVADIEKRAFLKLIGTAGISLFLFSIFNRRSGAAFFGKSAGQGATALEDSYGNKIDPSINQPTDGYRICEIDDNDITFYGFTNKDGAWYIMKEDSESSFRYSKGESNFSKNWGNREGLIYAYFHDAF